jgi:probable HAF family extracellular repeat protein
VDPTCPPPQIFAFEAVIWEPNGSGIRELPPLPGDTGASAAAINDKGQAVGTSGTCAVGPIEAVLWEKGKPIDLGNLGGAVFNIAFALNNRGQIIGQSNLPGNTTHHAFLWQNGVMTDLGTLRGVPGSLAEGINNKGQVVGFSDDFQGNEVALLWQNGAMFDMNTLVSTDSPWFLQEALGINERGQIVGFALNTISGEVHGFLATPIEGSESPATAAQARSTETPRVIVPEKVREMLRHQYRWPGLGK